jgi:hypothetical protein
VGYAPRRNPEIVVAAVIQGSSEHGGTTAGPVVRDVVKAYFDKKSGVKVQEFTAKQGQQQPKVVPTSVDDPSLTQTQDPPSR